MNIISGTSSGFTPVSKVKIPDVYYRRFKTGKEDLDEIFGQNGFVPGMTFTIAAPPGSGKTTILLQTLEYIQNTGQQSAYVSGEETVHQLAFTCQRLGITNVAVANMTTIEDVFENVKKNRIKMLVVDSFPSMRSRQKLHGRRLEEYLSNYICTKAKELECVVGIILHTTKTGQYKGSTLLPHSVDCNILVKLNEADRDVREFVVTKNRFGPICETAFRMSSVGFDFTKVDLIELETKNEQPAQKKKKPEIYKEHIMSHVKEHGDIDLQIASRLLECSVKAQYTLRDLVLQGILEKTGRGQKASWVPA